MRGPGYFLLANHSTRDSDVEDIDRCFTIGVWIVILYLNLQRGNATYLSANLSVDDRGNLVWLFSLMMDIVYISAVQSCLSKSFSYHSMVVVNWCIVGYLDILS